MRFIAVRCGMRQDDAVEADAVEIVEGCVGDWDGTVGGTQKLSKYRWENRW